MEEAKNINYPLLYLKTNIVESANRILKDILMSKKLCSNWLYIVKKIINYNSNDKKDSNFVNKINKEKIENNKDLHFLNDYTPFYVNKYLKFWEKTADVDDYNFFKIID